MNINVPPFARDHFWEEPPPGSWEFWSFRFPPPCKVGEKLVFRFDGKPVAEAVCATIEPPGQSRCDATGRFGSGWKVYWTPESFREVGTHEPQATHPLLVEAKTKRQGVAQQSLFS